MRGTKHSWMKWVRFGLCTLFFLLCWQGPVLAQQPVKKYSVRNGKMFIELDRWINEASLDSFITKFNLAELDLKSFIKNAIPDSLRKLGWTIDVQDAKHIVISKPFMALDNLDNPADRIIYTEKQLEDKARFPAVSSAVRYGYNRFRNKVSFTVTDSVVTFFLRDYDKANQVMLAGSFNNWSPDALPMTRTDSGWIAKVRLGAGKYWYKFVVDGRWITDNDNQLREADGQGNINSVFFQTNFTFTLNGFTNARRVILAGSFNGWKERELQMEKTDKGWQLPLYLAQGTHTYRYIVDGRWMADPNNKDQFPNEFNDYNSVIQIGKAYPFRLNGYIEAKQVILSGSFNGWRDNELYMRKTASGWELPYVLGPGNYEYQFIVDNKRIADPTSALTVAAGGNNRNSFLIINPNYEFRLKGFPTAKTVYLAGDFNNWNPKSLAMQKQGDEWVVPIHLGIGKHRYKYIIDGEWKLDPSNKLWEQNEYGNGNSIIWIER
jgi:hypothetical protein